MIGQAFRTLLVGATLGFASLALGQTFTPASSVKKAGAQAHTNYVVFRGSRAWVHARGAGRATIQGYYPSDIRAAYGLPASGGTQTIAIIDAYDLPTALNDFNVFSAQFGLPQETSKSATSSSNKVLQVVYASGKRPQARGDYGGEIALDIEWAHAIAPNAKILLVEAATNNVSDLVVAIRKAAALTDVKQVSMSFGASEYSGETSLDDEFDVANHTFFAAAGDTANELDYPAASPNVVGVGGTSLNVVGGRFVSESAWEDSGGGPSRYEPRPSYQSGFVGGAFRGTPDLSAVGDPNTGVAVYVSTPLDDGTVGWAVFGGTSLSCPVVAAITNLRGGFATSTAAELARQYGSYAGTIRTRDITTGSAGAYDAAPGYDFITGLGSPTYAFPTTAYAPTALQANAGYRVGGIPANAVVKDGRDYVLRAGPLGAEGAVGVSAVFSAPLSAGATRAGASLSVTGMTSGTGFTVTLFNVATQRYDTLSTANLGVRNGTLTLPIANPDDYFDANGRVLVLLDARGASGFRLGLDQVQLSVTTDF